MKSRWNAIWQIASLLVILSVVLVGCQGKKGEKAAEAQTELEIFSWWTSGGEVGALNAVYDIFSEENPTVTVENAALAGGQGQGGNMKALLLASLALAVSMITGIAESILI